jgi:DNA helicase-2/ATP-dependent DNA helicase PcrA
MPVFQHTGFQQEAIDHREGNLLILACAGSGKTHVVSRRIAELVAEGVPRNKIVAFTFTERAAEELKSRIRQHLEELKPDDPALGDMYIGTIHSFCLNLLSEIDPQYRNYEVMDEDQQAALIMTNYHYFPDSDTGIGLDRLSDDTMGYWKTVETFIRTLNVIYQKGIELEDIPDPTLRAAVRRYWKIVYDDPNYFFDFNGIISALLDKLKESPEELESLRSQFRYLIVDEYQDVDDRQEELIWLLSDGGRRVHVTAVGDDDQAIYRWRGAKIDNILSFQERYPDVTEVTLSYNFRSTHAIVEVADSAIREIPPGERIAKEMEARHWDADILEFRETMAEEDDIQLRAFETEAAEAAWVAARVEQLRGTIIQEPSGQERAIDYADMAVLLRSVKSCGEEFVQALRDRGIPVVVKGTGGLFGHDEILLLQATWCLLGGLDFLVKMPGFDNRISLDERQTRDFIRDRIRTLKEQGIMPHASENAFLEWVAGKKVDLSNSRRIYPQDIFQEMLAQLGIAKGPDTWPQDILYNLGQLSYLITQFEAVHHWVTPSDIQPLCMYLGGWATGRVDEGGLEEAGTPNAVQIMTVHAAKGLEWPVVFIPRVTSYHFPSSYRRRGPKTFLDEDTFDPSEYASGDQGERRLWYVALTRCGKFLNVTSLDRTRKRPTVYYKDIHHNCVQSEGPIAAREKGVPVPPADTELLPTTYSDLRYFWRCPFEYQLRSLMGFNPGVTESYGYGKQIHNVLAEIHKRALDGEHLSADEAAELLEERFHLRYTRGDPLDNLREAARDTICRYFDEYPDATSFVLDAEKPFEFVDRESDCLISGTVDLLERIEKTPDGERRVPVAIIDFKTHRWESIEKFEKDKAQVEDQLQLYAVGAGEALRLEADEARAHFLSPSGPEEDLREQGASEVVSVDISSSAKEEILERVGDAVAKIKDSVAAGDFELEGWKNDVCPDCDFRLICPGFELYEDFD